MVSIPSLMGRLLGSSEVGWNLAKKSVSIPSLMGRLLGFRLLLTTYPPMFFVSIPSLMGRLLG